MSLTVRRVVTGHDENGRAIVPIDETFKNVVQTRPGAHAAVHPMSALPPKADITERDRHVDPVRRKVGRTTAPGQAVSCASFA